MSIEESNKLIAEFMGKEIYQEHHESHYESSYGWLMPVVEKIISTDNNYFDLTIKFGATDDYITFRTRSKYNRASNLAYNMVVCEQNKGIETVYKTVVEFIKWYNKQD